MNTRSLKKGVNSTENQIIGDYSAGWLALDTYIKYRIRPWPRAQQETTPMLPKVDIYIYIPLPTLKNRDF